MIEVYQAILEVLDASEAAAVCTSGRAAGHPAAAGRCPALSPAKCSIAGWRPELAVDAGVSGTRRADGRRVVSDVAGQLSDFPSLLARPFARR